MDFFVSPIGSDFWSGRLAEPNADGTDGPIRHLDEAQRRVRALKYPLGNNPRGMTVDPGRVSEGVTIWLRGGIYPQDKPLRFDERDSAPVRYAAYGEETPIIDGGLLLCGWQEEWRGGQRTWVTHLPEVAAGRWYFHSLFVNGGRRARPRWPKEGFLEMEEVPDKPIGFGFFNGSDVFRAKPGDFQAWKNLTEVEVIALHFWVDEHLPVASYDEETRLVQCRRRSVLALQEDGHNQPSRYYVTNVAEALSEPGEWYLDRLNGVLTYLPLPEETLEDSEIYAPRLTQLLTFMGNPDRGEWVDFLRFEGLTFRHTDAPPPDGRFQWSEHWSDPEVQYASVPQAAFHVPGAVALEGARWCAFSGCMFAHLGGYALDIGDGCTGIQIRGCEMRDLAAGGVKISGADADGPRIRRTGHCRVSDCHIYDAGCVFHQAVGILIRHSFGNIVAHNHIHHLFYTAISCGWVWGYDESVARDNIIEKNHLHNLGFRVLSDMGGIYLLGMQPGSVVRGNVIHDISDACYGGFGIYLDEGSTGIVVENNLCYRTTGNLFHQHYGMENSVRNNIFAHGQAAAIGTGRAEPHRSFTFERNIVVSRDQPFFSGPAKPAPTGPGIFSDLNLFWSEAGPNEIEALQQQEAERHSVFADPGFATGEYKPPPDSPALALGFLPFDTSDVGPRQ